MSNSLVYLAGPITGVTFSGCTDWRAYASSRFAEGISGVSPMRAKDYLKRHATVVNSSDEHPLSTDRGVNTRDHWDCKRCDVVLANLLGADRVSIGTVMEIAWARAYGKPLIVVMEPEGNVHDHCMVRDTIGFRVQTLDEGIDIVNSLLVV